MNNDMQAEINRSKKCLILSMFAHISYNLSFIISLILTHFIIFFIDVFLGLLIGYLNHFS